MALFLLPVIVYAFLLLGSLVFVACALVPPAQKYALSAAFWCAIWGPGILGFLMLAALLLDLKIQAHDFLLARGASSAFLAQQPLGALGKAYIAFSVLATAVAATAAAWAHQKLVRRFTFALFRLYTAGVCAGIGSVFGIALGLLIAWQTHWMSDTMLSYLVLGIGTLILMALFAAVAYKYAAHLRGPAPTTFTWITPEEFTGTDRL